MRAFSPYSWARDVTQKYPLRGSISWDFQYTLPLILPRLLFRFHQRQRCVPHQRYPISVCYILTRTRNVRLHPYGEGRKHKACGGSQQNGKATRRDYYIINSGSAEAAAAATCKLRAELNKNKGSGWTKNSNILQRDWQIINQSIKLLLLLRFEVWIHKKPMLYVGLDSLRAQ